MQRKLAIFFLLSLAMVFIAAAAAGQGSGPDGETEAQVALGTAFTYQGRLTDDGSAANGVYDFRFLLYDAANGSQVGNTVARNDIAVADGLFSVPLDFGNVFTGEARYLEVQVRPGSSSGAYTALTPRQALTPAPQALALPNVFTSGGNVGIGTTAPTGLLHVAGNAYATAFLPTSDRNAKENVAPVDEQAVLEKVAALPMSTWSFKTEPGVRHLGPMAQDFHAAFGLGPNDTTIPTVDADGVALAAIQALYTENQELKRRVDALERALQREEEVTGNR